jgi:MprA protease rhombosortase-interaction domain-containing protein
MEHQSKRMGSVAAAMAAGATALALTLGAAQPAQALQSLVPGSQETSGDKLFTLTSCTYQMAVCTADVGEFFGIVQNGLFGVTITGPMGAPLLTQGPDQDISLQFLVQTTTGAATITDVQLIVAGEDGGAVGELVRDQSGFLTFGGFNVVLPQTTDTLVLPVPPAPVSAIRIDKDINALNGQIDSVTQLISQVSTVPLPGSLALLATGLLGFALRRRAG